MIPTLQAKGKKKEREITIEYKNVMLEMAMRGASNGFLTWKKILFIFKKYPFFAFL